MKTIVLGGGVSGLSAAHYLLKKSAHNVTVMEASNILGGWVQTVKDPSTGVIFEKGPRTVRPRGEVGLNTLKLVHELGLVSKVMPVLQNHPSAKNRMIFVKDKLYSLPSSLSSIFRKIDPFSKPLIVALFNDMWAPKLICTDDNIYNFVERRFGKEVADYTVSPMICGICAGDAKQISVKFLMPFLFDAEQKHGSIIKGLWKEKFPAPTKNFLIDYNEAICKRACEEKWSVWGLQGGMYTLIKSLENNICNKGGHILLNSEVCELSFDGNKIKCVLSNGQIHECDHVISALPAKKLAGLIRGEHPQLSEELSNINAVTVGVVNVVYKNGVLKHNAFGLLVPPSQSLPILGIIFDTCSFSQKDWTVLTVMVGGHWFQEYFGDKSTEDIKNVALTQIKNILGITCEPVSQNVSILKDCIPQYVVGHYDRVERIFSYINSTKLPLSLVGASYNGVGLNDVIMSSKKAVFKMLTNVQ